MSDSPILQIRLDTKPRMNRLTNDVYEFSANLIHLLRDEGDKPELPRNERYIKHRYMGLVGGGGCFWTLTIWGCQRPHYMIVVGW